MSKLNNKIGRLAAGLSNRRTFLTSVAAVAALGPMNAHSQIARPRILSVGSTTEPNSFDPQFQYFGPNRQAHLPIFEPLTTFGPALELLPSLAVSWRAVDPTVWELRLRPGVLFQDGSAFSAEDVVFSLARAPTVPNSPSSMGVYTQAISKVVAVDALTLRIETKETAPLLMYDLANVPILSKKISLGATTASFDAGIGIVGTGPYRFVRWQKGVGIEYEAFAGHWGGRPAWDQVKVRLLADGAERVKSLLAHEVQLIDQVPPSQIQTLRSVPGVKLFETPSNFLLYLHMDQFRETSPYITDRAGRPIRNPLLDARVRRALSMAIDRSAITKTVLSGSAIPANQFLPSTFPGTIANLPATPFDPRVARELLTAAGYPDGFKLVIHGTRNRYANDVEVLQAIAKNLDQIGIEAQAISLPSNEFFARASGGKNGEPEFSVIQTGWASIEPSGALKGLMATSDKNSGAGSSNRGRYSNPKVDGLLKQALATVDDAKRGEVLQAATRLAISEDQGIIPLYFPTNTWAATRGVKFAARVDSSTLPMDAIAER